MYYVLLPHFCNHHCLSVRHGSPVLFHLPRLGDSTEPAEWLSKYLLNILYCTVPPLPRWIRYLQNNEALLWHLIGSKFGIPRFFLSIPLRQYDFILTGGTTLLLLMLLPASDRLPGDHPAIVQ